MAFTMKAPFKGTVTVKARGDLAKAYWSVTPGMNLLVTGFDQGDKVYVAETIEVLVGDA